MADAVGEPVVSEAPRACGLPHAVPAPLAARGVYVTVSHRPQQKSAGRLPG